MHILRKLLFIDLNMIIERKVEVIDDNTTKFPMFSYYMSDININADLSWMVNETAQNTLVIVPFNDGECGEQN